MGHAPASVFSAVLLCRYDSAFVEDVADSDGGGSSDEDEEDGSDDLSGFITTTTGAEETPGATDRCALQMVLQARACQVVRLLFSCRPGIICAAAYCTTRRSTSPCVNDNPYHPVLCCAVCR